MADEKPTYENNPLRRAYERAADQMDDALRQEGEDIADAIGGGGKSESSESNDKDALLQAMRQLMELTKSTNEKMDELIDAVRDIDTTSRVV